jgi:hypothetical protein
LGLKTIGGGFTGLGLKTRAEVSRRNGRHVEAKLPVRRCGGRRINMKTGLDLYALGLIGLALMYPGAFRRM